ncbi:MAG TPA: dipeptide epimerase [Lacipirellulaceae bacterium]|jgi:muconate cycloisomerase
MRIRHLTAYVVSLPLKRPFVHATATRQESENVFIRCELADGTTGWGEGVPRSYVTGETASGCIEQLAATRVAEQLAADCNSWPDAIRLCEGFRPATMRDDPRGCYGNALRCAIELSALDAFGRLFGEPVSAVTRHYEPAAPIRGSQSIVRYGAVIDAGGSHLRRSALVRRLYGFRDCKVKVGREGDDDAARMETIRRWIGPHIDLRIDVNGAWRAMEVSSKMEPLLTLKVSCVEQPAAHAELAALADVRKQVSVPIMLDESLTGEPDARRAIELCACDLFNIRLSKCGGYLASLRLAAIARDAGLGYQLGCHPGESGILSAAGRHWASSVAGVRYLEGSYDRHLFRRLVTREDITFGYGGRARALTSPGLGVTIDTTVLADFTKAERQFPVT